MPAFTHVTDHVEQALARLTSAYRDKPRVRALVTAIARQVQLFEDAVDGVRSSQSLEGALAIGGEPLDALGDLVGQPRGPLDDASFERYIRGRIRVNRSQGLPEDAYKIIRALLPDHDAYQVELAPHYPAAFTMTVHGALGDDRTARDYHDMLQQGAKAGVRVGLRYALTPDSELFTFDDAGPGFDVGVFAGAY